MSGLGLSMAGVLLGAGRLAVFALLVTGAWVTVGRARLADLATAAAVGAGAYAGGVAAGLTELPVLLGLVTGAAAGALVGAAAAAVGGRVGGAVAAVTSLAFGLAVVAALAAVPGAGGVAGFHAVPFLTPWEALDVTLAVAALAVGAVAAGRFARSAAGAAAAVAAANPVVSAAVGRRPVRDAAAAGAVGGAVLGLGGATLAAVTGSVQPGAFTLGLAVALALAALVGGPPPLGPLVGAAVVWGPSIVFPLVPIVGDAQPLLLTGPLALAVLAVRRGRPLWVTPTPRPSESAKPPAPPTARDDPGSTPRVRGLQVRGAQLPGGTIDLTVAPGEVIALVGPNGAGKSTLLARIAGQLDDEGRVTFGEPSSLQGAPGRLGGRDRRGGRGRRGAPTRQGTPTRQDTPHRGSAPTPRGAAARARAGVARTWQRPPDVPDDDLDRLVGVADPATAWVRDLLADAGRGGVDDRAARQLLRLAAQRPTVALLDEPAAELPVQVVATALRGFADRGAAVLVVEHRPEIAAAADRVVTLTGRGARSDAAGSRPRDATDRPAPRPADDTSSDPADAPPRPAAGVPPRPADDPSPDPADVPRRPADDPSSDPADAPPRPAEAPPRPAADGPPRPAAPRLDARLHLPGGAEPVTLTVARGEAVRVDDRRIVQALLHRRDRRDRIVLDGTRVDRRGAAARVRAGLAAVRDAPVAADVSVADHLAAVVGVRRATALLADAPLLAGRGDDPAGVLSGGERRVLAWLVAIAVSPAAVILDGAGAGFDDDTLHWAGDRVRDWRRQGAAVIVRPSRTEETVWIAR